VEENLKTIIDRMLLLRVEFNMTNFLNGITKDGKFYFSFFTHRLHLLILCSNNWCNFVMKTNFLVEELKNNFIRILSDLTKLSANLTRGVFVISMLSRISKRIDLCSL
jgi:hypothetical protein